MNWPLLVFIAFLGMLALIPARRLRLAGWSPGAAAAYSAVVWLVAAILVLSRGSGTRLLLPLLLVLWAWPFVTWREGLDRLLGRKPTSEPRNVTPEEFGAAPAADVALDGRAVRVREVREVPELRELERPPEVERLPDDTSPAVTATDHSPGRQPPR